MAKFRCVCGYAISTSNGIPNPDEWRCYSDRKVMGLGDTVQTVDLIMMSTYLYRCPQSDHMWAFWDGLDRDPSVYAPMELPSHGK